MIRALTAFTSIARMSISRQKKKKIPIHLPFSDPDSLLSQEKICHYLTLHQCGVYLFLHPSSIVARSIYLDSLKNLSDNKHINGSLISVVRHQDRLKVLRSPHLMDWFKESIDISTSEPSGHISRLLKKTDRVAIVIDGIDSFWEHPQIESFIVGMGEDSTLTQRYVVLLPVTSTKFYNRACLWNNCDKVRGIR